LCHGDRAARQAAETAKKTFEEGSVGSDIPVFAITSAELGKGVAAYELFRLAGLADTGGESRRLIRGGGARMNDRKLEDENELIGPALFRENKMLKLSAGRKKHMMVKLT
jgi:tyrosyl-tRNA synthetase